MAAPTFQALGPQYAVGAGTSQPQWPAHMTGDIALLFVESANQAITLSSAAGFVEIPTDSPQGTGAAGGTTSTKLACFWCRATSGSMSNPQVAATADHTISQILTFRGCVTTGNPWDVTGGNTGTSSTSVTIPAITTTITDTLIVAAVASAFETTTPQVSGYTNANLTSITERTDIFTASGNGGGFAVVTGIKATASTTGTTTATLVNASVQGRIILALKSPSSGGGGGTPSAIPTFQASGTAVHGTGAVSPTWPSHLENDIALLLVESANETISLTTAAGFVQIADSPQGTGTAAGSDATKLAIYWCRATSAAMGAPTVADPGDHVAAQILTFRGCIQSGNPWDVTSGDVQATDSATVTIPGDTTTVENCLVVVVSSDARDVTSLQYSGWTNADLSSVTEIADYHTNDGNGGGFGAASGGKAAIGAYGATTATLAGSTNAVQGRISIALKPPSPGGGGGGTPTPGDTNPHRYWRMLLKNTPGAGPEVNEIELVERSGTVAALGSLITDPAQMHPGITHVRPMFRANWNNADLTGQWDVDVSYMTVPAGYVPSLPTDQITRTVETVIVDDGTLDAGVGQSDGASSLPLVKGAITGFCRHGDVIVFSDQGRVFQLVPDVNFDGGLPQQPESKWGTAAAVDAGTASSAPTAATRQYLDQQARDLTTSGFTASLRLRQKGTITQRSLAFAGTLLKVIGDTEAIGTLTNAPSADNQYQIGVQATISLRSKNGQPFTVQLGYGLDTTIDSGATWQVRDTGTFNFITTHLVYEPFSSTVVKTINVSGLTSDGTDRIRLRVVNIVQIGLGDYVSASSGIFGGTGVSYGADNPPAGVQFVTASDTYASQTPDTNDFVKYTAKGLV